MDPVSAMALLKTITEVSKFIGTELELAKQNGEITEAQLEDVRSRAKIADDEWAAVVAKAKADISNNA